MNNTPAFPRTGYIDTSNGTLPDGDDVIRHNDGMTLRDYFAAHIMQGMIAAGDERHFTSMSHEAYAGADYMLEAREK